MDGGISSHYTPASYTKPTNILDVWVRMPSTARNGKPQLKSVQGISKFFIRDHGDNERRWLLHHHGLFIFQL